MAIERKRAPAIVPDGEGWVGKRCRFKLHGWPEEDGLIVRMASTKHLAVWVRPDRRTGENLLYVKDITPIEGD